MSVYVIYVSYLVPYQCIFVDLHVDAHINQSPRPWNGNDAHDFQAWATATGCTTRCTQVQTIPGPKTPAAPENEALAYDLGMYCDVHPATASLRNLAASPFRLKTS